MENDVMAKAERLDKYLANSGAGSRSEVKNHIRKGRVTVNGVTCTVPEQKVDADTDIIALDGNRVFRIHTAYYMFHKPAGCVTATQDNLHRTVMDYIKEDRIKDLFPVGRLDIDTEGLLLITNDGALAHRLLSPAHHVVKEYYAEVRGCVTEKEVQAFAEGMDIGEKKKTFPAVLDVLCAGEQSKVTVKIQEGKFHQIKRMFQALGMEVLYLKRISMGTLRLDDALEAGQYRPLTDEETAGLLKGSVL